MACTPCPRARNPAVAWSSSRTRPELELDAVLRAARDLGFLGPGPIEEQREHAAAFARAFDPVAVEVAVDLGSGGGLPGLVLAALLPETRWVLADAMRRRTTFLEDAVASLGFTPRVTVVTMRAEELGRTSWRASADLVVARGFGRPAVTAECAAPLLHVGGILVVSEPPGAPGERWPEAVEQLGLAREAVLPGPPAFVRLRQVAECPDRFPRRTGVPAKRPLWY